MELIACTQWISLFKSMNCVSFILTFNVLNEHYLQEWSQGRKKQEKGKGRKLRKSLLTKKKHSLPKSCRGYGAAPTRESPRHMPFIAPPWSSILKIYKNYIDRCHLYTYKRKRTILVKLWHHAFHTTIKDGNICIITTALSFCFLLIIYL